LGRRSEAPRSYQNIEILAGSGEGHAIAKINDKVIFVKYAVPGDIVDIKIVGRKKRFSIAAITQIVKPSPYRVPHFCDHYEVCGGCKWQHIAYEQQAKLKQDWAADCIERIGKVEVKQSLPILTPETQTFYRNKMEYTFSNKRWLLPDENTEVISHMNALGFHASGKFDKVVNIHKCWLQDDRANEIRNFVRDFTIENQYTYYDLRDHNGLLRNLIIRNTTLGQWMIIVCFAENDAAKIDLLMNAIHEKFSPTSLFYLTNTKKNDTIFDQDVVLFSGKSVIEESLCGLTFEISPKSFFQTNSKQAEKLYETALNFAELNENQVVYDLYCGTGTLTLAASLQAKKVIGVELIPEAIDAAKANQIKNNRANVSFVVGDMKDVFNQDFYRENGFPNVIITDPPRSGMHPQVIKQLLNISCERIVYVSCNPATQARDLEMLSEKYEVVKMQPVDMFPQTHHVEQVALLVLK
jgi:23S rRNA (uracil1939-C5)-methyltransferase